MEFTTMSVGKIKINENHHLEHQWKVHALLSDFELEDVWRVPVVLTDKHPLSLFLDQFSRSNSEVLNARSIAGWLFRFRLFLGRIFKWDERPERHQLLPGSIRERYALSEYLTFEELPSPGNGDFIPVYLLENEFLSEIENNTVHAALHIGRVRLGKNNYAVQMAIYVKPKGFFGKAYMQLIKPFRHWIVYPELMKSARRSWERFLKTKH